MLAQVSTNMTPARFGLWWCDRDRRLPAKRDIQQGRRTTQSGFARSRVEVSEQVLSQILLRSSLQQRQSLPTSVAVDHSRVGLLVIPKLARLDPPPSAVQDTHRRWFPSTCPAGGC
jgi:hypothetical protein